MKHIEHIYKGNLIIEYNTDSFMATWYVDGEVNSDYFKSLELAQKFLDDNGYSIEED